MSLDGLRAWIGEVERKLGMRTRVFLVLAAIAIAGAAAGIYLALDAADESVSKDEVRALQEQVEAASGAIGTTGGETAAVAALEGEVKALREQIAELRSEGASSAAKPPGGASRAERQGSGGSSSGTAGQGSSAGGEVAPTDRDEAEPSAKSKNESE
jgi:cell division protein FtsB